MKLLYISLLGCLFLFSNCTPVKTTTATTNSRFTAEEMKYIEALTKPKTDDKSIVTDDNTISLTDYLRRLSGVQVTGDGPGAQIRVGGLAHSFYGNSDPLFVVNGQQVGTNFATIHSTVNVIDIKNIKVLKDPTELSMYGTNALCGVIVINTKTGEK